MIIDTNTYGVPLLRDAKVAELLRTSTQIGLPLPVIAELRTGFIKGTKFIENEALLADFMNRADVTILQPNVATTLTYGELQVFARSKGRVLSDNDIWIAALAREDGDTLVTYDQDFAVFQEIFGDKLVIL